MADNYTLIREYLDLIVAQEWEKAMEFWTDDITIHASGHSRFGGTHTGRAAAAEYLGGVLAAVDSVKIEEHDLLASDDHAVVLNTTTSTKGDQTFASNRVIIYHIEGDKITELWIIDEDQAAADAFIA